MDKKQIMKECVSFVKGKTTFDEFQRNYEKNSDYRKVLDDKKPNAIV